MFSRRMPIVVSAIAIAAVFSGCGKHDASLAPLTGAVAYHGKPLSSGVVILQPERGQYATGNIQQDGTFEMTTPGKGTGAAIGKNSVRILCRGNDNAKSEGFNGRSLIPEKYASCSTSGITVNVRPGENPPLRIDLKE